MFTLERKEDQVISKTHGREILKVRVSLISGNKVKLFFDGPESFEVWREEVNESNTTTI